MDDLMSIHKGLGNFEEPRKRDLKANKRLRCKEVQTYDPRRICAPCDIMGVRRLRMLRKKRSSAETSDNPEQGAA